jgi:hypothetical protein
MLVMLMFPVSGYGYRRGGLTGTRWEFRDADARTLPRDLSLACNGEMRAL